MRKDVKHIKNRPEFNGEIREMISGSSIAWSKTKEEIWPELLERMEGKSAASENTHNVYFTLQRLAVAAVFLLLLSIPAVMFFYTKTVENPAQHTKILLPDNSRVTVNARSVLSFKPLLWKFKRSVKFEGEAFFEVQKGKKFEVASKKGKTIVLGTEFKVYSRDNDYIVTCTSGKVKVIEAANQNEVILTPIQKAILRPDGTFEIQDLNKAREVISTSPQSQSLEEKLNEVLSKTEIEEQTENKKEPVSKQASVKKPTTEKKQEQAKELNGLKEQNKSQDHTGEDLQNSEQSKATTPSQAENKEQSANSSQEDASSQNTEVPQKQDKLRASLTPEQIKILENKQMTREERRKAFMESLSSEQRNLLKEQNKERSDKSTSGESAGSNDEIKEQQKMQVRDQLRENTGKETQKQQMQQNRENTKPNAENGTSSGPNNGGSANQNGRGD